MDITKSKGNLTELMCIMKFMEYGFEVSIPYGDSAKYDFIVDMNGKLLKIQCKTSSYSSRNGVVDQSAFSFSTICQTTNTQKTIRHRYTQDQIDYFATSFLGNVYIVPIEECSTSKTLRLIPPKNNQKCNMAEDYLMENIFKDEIDFDFKNKNRNQNNEQIKQNFCIDCGKVISLTAIRCVSCSQIASRKVERPSREELKHMIRTLPFIKIGEHFNVSDNAVRKWCQAMNLPFRSSEIKMYSDMEWQQI